MKLSKETGWFVIVILALAIVALMGAFGARTSGNKKTPIIELGATHD